jgi:hypothetical protein
MFDASADCGVVNSRQVDTGRRRTLQFTIKQTIDMQGRADARSEAGGR